MNNLEIREERNLAVWKSNELIRQARFDLNVTELKILNYVIAKVKPTDKEFQEYTISIHDFCQIIGIQPNNGGNIAVIRNALISMVNKSFIITLEDGTETSVSWINKMWISKGSSKVRVRLDDDLQKFLVGLYSNFTQYTLLSILPMRSSYSIRIYELLKSYAYKKSVVMDIDILKAKIGAQNYDNFKDFRRKVLEIATKEINQFGDIEVSWEPITHGRKVIQVKFWIKVRDRNGQLLSALNAEEALETVGESVIKKD